MKEQLISFETAKLAKEKGFNLKTPKYYTTENPHSYHKDLDGVCILGLLHSKTLYEPQDEIDKKSGISKYKLDPSTVFAPTQSLLQKWLREVHKINVESNYLPNIQKYRCLFKPMHIIPKLFESFKDYKKVADKYYGKIDYNSYEEALEKGLQEALKLI